VVAPSRCVIRLGTASKLSLHLGEKTSSKADRVLFVHWSEERGFLAMEGVRLWQIAGCRYCWVIDLSSLRPPKAPNTSPIFHVYFTTTLFSTVSNEPTYCRAKPPCPSTRHTTFIRHPYPAPSVKSNPSKIQAIDCLKRRHSSTSGRFPHVHGGGIKVVPAITLWHGGSSLDAVILTFDVGS